MRLIRFKQKKPEENNGKQDMQISWKQFKDLVREACGNACAICETKGNLTVHHIRPVSMNGKAKDEKNAILLCQECHTKVSERIDELNRKQKSRVKFKQLIDVLIRLKKERENV